ncbi:MAG TPA: MazG nucleotide pyrophosphohydrolase domain-containing protein [Candidatus Hydrogenedentes bacterium]|nr:MazG nucleotide pyrophosphohydrolase domain-containing protein [Candidatus Hydrogenedentota bacterium]HOL75935.1 MazG nucleotide pyrophosphohydrolase domain-containing protein [Candidatus Hydrogenedentota bacterium]HPO85656.1 MazG nucleotide pyrophosphohydrolase domain-containing protein [Candidatus Hydrogenedentota bacterium]
MAELTSTDGWKKALNVQHAAAACGFDWPDISGVVEKLAEEVDEIRSALRENNIEHARDELGDLLFAAANLARFLQADPHRELMRATERFSRRFALLEREVARSGKSINRCSLQELDEIWEQIKLL